MGWWRGLWQGIYVAIKFPLIMLVTTCGNAMLAPLLGLNVTLRQSISAVMMSFAITAAILGGFAPLMAFRSASHLDLRLARIVEEAVDKFGTVTN